MVCWHRYYIHLNYPLYSLGCCVRATAHPECSSEVSLLKTTTTPLLSPIQKRNYPGTSPHPPPCPLSLIGPSGWRADRRVFCDVWRRARLRGSPWLHQSAERSICPGPTDAECHWELEKICQNKIYVHFIFQQIGGNKTEVWREERMKTKVVYCASVICL